MSEKTVWIVLVSGGAAEGEGITHVFKVFSDESLAALCVEWVKRNRFNRKIEGMWADDVWVEEYTVHERAAP